MGFDSISNGLLPSLNKDFAKKKRTNRLAKLKQSKLDVRREQWLSQVKNKGYKMDSNGKGVSPPSPMQMAGEHRPLDSSEPRSRGEENEGSSIHDSDSESLMSSPIGSSLGHSDSSNGLSGSSSHSSSSSSASSGDCSGSASEEEEDDGCLDDWETFADALNANENEPNPIPVPPAKYGNSNLLADPELSNLNTGSNVSKGESTEVVTGSHVSCRAWRSDDAFRPQCLPNLSKQHSFGLNSEQQSGHGAIPRVWQSAISQPSSCPICYEDLDVTDTSFLPCSCGFRLCLFCHKRVLEADARCPGCRKHYDPLSGSTGCDGVVTPFRIAQSSSLSTRS